MDGGLRFHPRLSVLAGYLKKLGMDPDETWWTGWVYANDELIIYLVKFWIRIRELFQ